MFSAIMSSIFAQVLIFLKIIDETSANLIIPIVLEQKILVWNLVDNLQIVYNRFWMVCEGLKSKIQKSGNCWRNGRNEGVYKTFYKSNQKKISIIIFTTPPAVHWFPAETVSTDYYKQSLFCLYRMLLNLIFTKSWVLSWSISVIRSSSCSFDEN